MAKVDPSARLFILTLSLMTYTTKAVDIATRIRKTVGAHLVLLNAHKSLFTETNKNTPTMVEDSKQNEFMSPFKSILGEANANEILQHLGPNWAYTLKIAKTTSKVTTLLVNMHAKYHAYIYGMNYLWCAGYYRAVKQMVAESCRNVAAHLLFYSIFGAEELEKKLSSALSAHVVFGGSVFESDEFYEMVRNLLVLSNHKYALSPFAKLDKETGSQYPPVENDREFTYIRKTLDINFTYAVEKIKLFFANLLFGKKDSENRVYQEEFHTLWNERDEIVLPMWNKAIEMNRKLTIKNDENTYGVIEIIQDVMKEYAVLYGNLKKQMISHEAIDREHDLIKPHSFIIFEESFFYDHNIQIVPSKDIDAVLQLRATCTCKTAASRLVLLETYNELFQKYGENTLLEQTKQDKFMRKWVEILGQNNANEIIQNVGAHWAYALKIGRTPNTVTTLLTAIHTKYLAYSYGMNYIWCAEFYKRGKNIMAESCRNVAAHLLHFGMFGVRKLGRNLISVLKDADQFKFARYFEDAIIEFHGNGIKLFDVHKYYLRPAGKGTKEYNERELEKETGSSYKSIENEWEYRSTKEWLAHYSGGVAEVEYHFDKILFGEKDSKYRQYKANIPILWHGSDEVVHPLWNKAIEINSKLGGKTGVRKYGIVDIIRDVTIEYAVLHGQRNGQIIGPRAIKEELERLKPAHLEFHTGDQRIEHNIKITE